MKQSFVLKGNLCYSKDKDTLETMKEGYLVCIDGVSQGIYQELPEEYSHFPLKDYGDYLLIPGLVDLHLHAPQFAFRGLGMDLELLEWLNTHTFKEESKYQDLTYAKQAYKMLVEELVKGPNTRFSIFGTIHLEATKLLMDEMEASGLVSYVGKVNMDRNSPDILRENNALESIENTRRWLQSCEGKYKNTKPILTPRFTPSCTDELMEKLGELQREYNLPVQSHLSENQGEIAWVKELCPNTSFYGEAYEQFGLFGDATPTIMAHCVWSSEEEIQRMRKNQVYVAHCPQSNENLSSGIAPIRRYLQEGIPVGLGSDIAGGCHTSIFRSMSDAIQMSKMYWRLINQKERPLTVEEVFYLGTLGGGSFFGKVGSFEKGYELDVVVIDDDNLKAPFDLSIEERLGRAIYLSDDRNVKAKYVRGALIMEK